MDRLGKLLFPKSPRLVRRQKLQTLGFAITFGFLACVIVGLLMYLLTKA
jgi:hypothetical protein